MQRARKYTFNLKANVAQVPKWADFLDYKFKYFSNTRIV